MSGERTIPSPRLVDTLPPNGDAEPATEVQGLSHVERQLIARVERLDVTLDVLETLTRDLDGRRETLERAVRANASQLAAVRHDLGIVLDEQREARKRHGVVISLIREALSRLPARSGQ